MSNKNESFIKDLLAGGFSGIIAKTVAAPVDRVKLLMQTQHINHALEVPYSSSLDCIKRVYREQVRKKFFFYLLISYSIFNIFFQFHSIIGFLFFLER